MTPVTKVQLLEARQQSSGAKPLEIMRIALQKPTVARLLVLASEIYILGKPR